MKSRCAPPPAAIALFICAVSFVVVGASQPPFLGIGFALLGVGIAMWHKARA